MKFKIAKEALAAASKSTARLCPVKDPMHPAWSMTRITAEADAVVVTASTGVASLVQRLAAEVDEPGDLCVDSGNLAKAVAGLPEVESVTVALKGEFLTLRARRTRHSLTTSEALHYPDVAEPEGELVQLKGEDLCQLITATGFAASQDISRQAVCALNFERLGDRLRATSTDGHRLSQAEVGAPDCGEGEHLMPAGHLRAIVDLASTVETLGFVEDQSRLFFVTAGATLSLQVVNGHFPPIEQLIPKESKTVIEVPRASLLAAVRQSSVFSNHDDGLALDFVTGTARLRAENDNAQQSATELDCKLVSGPECAVVLQGKYLTQALSACADGTITLGVSGPLDPVVVKGSAMGIIMPRRGR